MQVLNDIFLAETVFLCNCVFLDSLLVLTRFSPPVQWDTSRRVTTTRRLSMHFLYCERSATLQTVKSVNRSSKISSQMCYTVKSDGNVKRLQRVESIRKRYIQTETRLFPVRVCHASVSNGENLTVKDNRIHSTSNIRPAATTRLFLYVL